MWPFPSRVPLLRNKATIGYTVLILPPGSPPPPTAFISASGNRIFSNFSYSFLSVLPAQQCLAFSPVPSFFSDQCPRMFDRIFARATPYVPTSLTKEGCFRSPVTRSPCYSMNSDSLILSHIVLFLCPECSVTFPHNMAPSGVFDQGKGTFSLWVVFTAR